MSVLQYKDQADIWFREVVSRNYSALRKLETEYRHLQKRTWFNCYDTCAGEWVLTIELGRTI